MRTLSLASGVLETLSRSRAVTSSWPLAGIAVAMTTLPASIWAWLRVMTNGVLPLARVSVVPLTMMESTSAPALKTSCSPAVTAVLSKAASMVTGLGPDGISAALIQPSLLVSVVMLSVTGWPLLGAPLSMRMAWVSMPLSVLPGSGLVV